ncbi:MAG: hypothetical protein ACRDS0_25820 [Pseudonocardiaceae bacterium]
MTVLTSATEHHLSLMSDQDYLAYQRGFDDELTEYYVRGLTPPGMTPLPSTLTELEPPF